MNILLDSIQTSMKNSKPFIIALAGGSGSGKTTVSKIIATSLPWKTTIVPLDQFYADLSHLPLQERKKINFDAPESIDMDLAYHTIFDLHHGRETTIPVYDFPSYNRSSQIERLSPAPIILFEGMHVLYHEPLLELYDMSIFLNIDEQTRFERKLERDIRERGRTYGSVCDMWRTFTKPMHNIYVQPTCIRADLVFTDSFATQVIQVITDIIHQKINMSHNISGYLP
ncbi:MAG TPA: uridine kinase [Patescibacteria group bacterium]|nr:uridine kinase [Patescibacteria group bacterium]